MTMTQPVNQISVDQQGGGNYPLVIAEQNLDQLLADLFFYYSDELCQYSAPFRISWLGGFGTAVAEGPAPTHAQDLTINDANDEVVFDSRDAVFVSHNWDTLRVMEWQHGSSVLRVVQHTGSPSAWSSSFYPTNAEIDPRCIVHRTRRLDQLIVETPSGDVLIDDDSQVILAEGYNTSLTSEVLTTTDGGLRQAEILCEMIPGAGIGLYPGCNPVEELRELGDVTGNQVGSIGLQLDQCYRQELMVESVDDGVVTIEAGKIKLSLVCAPCARCEDFFAVYEALRRLHIRNNAAGKRLDAMHDAVQSAITRWQASSDCRTGSTLRLIVMPIGGCRVAIGAAICNNTESSLRNTSITLTLTARPSGAKLCIECRSVFRKGNYDGTSEIPTSQWQPYRFATLDPYRADFNCISPGDLGSVVFQLKFDGAEDGDQVSITASATGLDASPVSRSVQVVCNDAKNPGCCEATTTTTTPKPVTPPSGTTTTTGAPGPTTGLITSITRYSGDKLKVTLAIGARHSLIVGDRVTISGTSHAGYNATFTVIRILTSSVFVLSGTWTTNSTGGTYTELAPTTTTTTTSAAPPDPDPGSGTEYDIIHAVSHGTTGMWQVTTATSNSLVAGNRAAILGLGSGPLTVVEKLFANMVLLNRKDGAILPGSALSPGIRRLRRQYGSITKYKQYGSNKLLIEVNPEYTGSSDSGYSLYDTAPAFPIQVKISGSSYAGYNGTWTLLRGEEGVYPPEANKFLLDVDYQGAATGGMYSENTIPDPSYTANIITIHRFTGNTLKVRLETPDPQSYAVGDYVCIRGCAVTNYNQIGAVTFMTVSGSGLTLGVDIPWTVDATAGGTCIRLE